MTLYADVQDLLRRARGTCPDVFDQQLKRMAGPLRVAIAGQPKSGKSTLAALLGEGDFEIVDDEPDAVIYLLRHVHRTDLVMLERFHDRMNTVVVLAHADETGGGRLDAMSSARQIARRYAADARLRGLCQAVVPLAGLLARPLTDAEYHALATLATRPRAEVDGLLLSADRLGDRVLPDRFGMYGIRLGVTLIRQGFDNPAKLGAELARRSGIVELREQLAIHFHARAQLLQARSALIVLEKVLRDTPMIASVERVIASAHEFAEIRLLGALRAGHVPAPEDVLAEAERLLGARGATIDARLGHTRDQKKAVLAALGDWQRRAENPRSARRFVQAARVIVRTCEGMLAEITIRQPI
jgi:hypothetical protein